jgi:hypothetical protein
VIRRVQIGTHLNVSLPSLKVYRSQGGRDLNGNRGKLLLELSDPWHEPPERNGREQSDPQLRPHTRTSLARRAFKHREDRRRFPCVIGACLGQFDAALGPAEQRNAKPRLELYDVPADRTGSDVQFARSRCKALPARGAFEGTQGIERGQLGMTFATYLNHRLALGSAVPDAFFANYRA